MFAGNQVASQIPADFFLRRSHLLVQDDDDDGDGEGSAAENELSYNPPQFDDCEDYFSKFWTSLVDNEKILKEIQDVSQENQSYMNKIYNLEDFYESNLLPKMLAFPNHYVARVAKNLATSNTVAQSQKENVQAGEEVALDQMVSSPDRN